MTKIFTRAALVATVSLAVTLGAACSDDTEEKAKDALESAQSDISDDVQEGAARAAAEAFRGHVKAQDTDDDSGGVRNVDVLNEAAGDLPGDPEVSGIEDDDGDGVDDDGLVEIEIGGEKACVELPESGNEIDVTGGAC